MRIDWLEPGLLAAGGLPLGLGDLEDLQRQGIRAVLTLTELPLSQQRELTPEALAQADVISFHFPIADYEPPDAGQIELALDFLDRMRAEGRPVYVHCHAGVGRTGTMLHLYYLHQGCSLDEAKAKVKAGKLTSQFLMLSASQQAFLEQLAPR